MPCPRPLAGALPGAARVGPARPPARGTAVRAAPGPDEVPHPLSAALKIPDLALSAAERLLPLDALPPAADAPALSVALSARSGPGDGGARASPRASGEHLRADARGGGGPRARPPARGSKPLQPPPGRPGLLRPAGFRAGGLRRDSAPDLAGEEDRLAHMHRVAAELSTRPPHGRWEVLELRAGGQPTEGPCDLNRAGARLPHGDASADAALVTGAECLADPLRALTEAVRVLRPGGALVAAVGASPGPGAGRGWRERTVPDRARLLRDYLEAAGLEGCRVTRGDAGGVLAAGRRPRAPAPGPLQAAVEARRGGGMRGAGHLSANVVLGEIELREEWEARRQGGGGGGGGGGAGPAGLSGPLRGRLSGEGGGGAGEERATYERWAAAYRSLAAEARALGVPDHAIPPLPDPPSRDGLRAARDRLSGIIASMLSSGL